jgi:predicted nucleotide-binding protein
MVASKPKLKVIAKKAAPAQRKAPTKSAAPPRTYLSQEDVPAYALDDALRVGRALVEQYGGRAATPLDVAAAMEMQPSSGGFRMLCGAAIAYGLTNGGYNAQEISLTPLGKRILRPLSEGDDMAAKREAVLRPRVLRDFLSKYSGASLPREDIALNVISNMGVPADRAPAVLALVLRSAEEVGFLRKIKEKTYVDLGGPIPEAAKQVDGDRADEPSQEEADDPHQSAVRASAEKPSASSAEVNAEPLAGELEVARANRRVFITHGKNMAFIEPIKKLLGFGEMIPVVSVEKQSVSQPVPDKVMNDMRTCSAAIIHVDGELTLLDQEAKEHVVINPNVLIEVGAAMALFGRRFILLVRSGVKLPSNLQGLYEVRYEGDALDGNATIRLLEAINDIKNNPLPGTQ